VGPVLGDGAIVYDEIHSIADLPHGWTDQQEPGSYRLRDGAPGYFAYTTPAQSWKQFLHPARQLLWEAINGPDGVRILATAPAARRTVFLGVRPCELRAMETQDRVFNGAYPDPQYKAARESALVVVAQCTHAGGTCFCTAMGGGPAAASGFDLAFTELADESIFLMEAGSDRGRTLLTQTGWPEAAPELVERARARTAEVALQMGRHLDTEGLAERLQETYGSARWEQVAKRCLSCANCTMVCPTCFCTTVEDTASLTGDHAQRWQRWDSCFTSDFTYIHGGAVRKSTASRYRQWLLHKLSTWQQQYGVSGCVGCGRCITWCPVGIDITEEARELQKAP
jgi:formate hydrogenlyase subunit 6/NADH:ubiquinone oxidoreductase subunit I